jgi:predicted transcriptional regulator
MAKPTISLPDGMLEDVDRRAAEAGITRSAFIQEAVARYGEALDEDRAAIDRQERIGRAIAGMRRIAEHAPPGPEAETIIRHLRDAPPRWLVDEENQ